MTLSGLTRDIALHQATLSRHLSDWRDENGDWLDIQEHEALEWAAIVLPDVDLQNFAAFESNFDRACLQNGSLIGARLYRSTFREAILTGVNFYKAELHKAILDGATLNQANLFKARLVDASCEGATFEEAECGRASFWRATLRRTSFLRANLSNATFDDADLEGADLTLANLGFAGFERTNLTGAILTGARIGWNCLAGALNIEQVSTDWIIACDYDYRSEIQLRGDKAHEWLREQAAMPRLPFTPHLRPPQ